MSDSVDSTANPVEEGTAVAEPQTISVIIELPESEQSIIDEIRFQSTNNETIDSVAQNIGLTSETSHLTCFDLSKNGEILMENEVLGDLAEENEKSELVVRLKLIEKKYSLRSVRQHVVKVREICGLSQSDIDPLGAEHAAVCSGSSRFTELKFDEKTFIKTEEKKQGSEILETSFNLTSEDNGKFESLKEEIVNGDDKYSLNELVIPKTSNKLAPALKNLSLSAWNPVNSHYRSAYGHLLYLQAQTLEGDNYHITATVDGFYLNNSSNTRFDPTLKTSGLPSKKFSSIIASKKGKFHSIYRLIELLSEKFNQVQVSNHEILINNNPLKFFNPSSTYLSTPWLVDINDSPANSPDYGKTQNQFLVGGADSGDLYRNWNADYQQFVELPKSQLADRVSRERLLNKTSFEFTTVATKTAIEIINGNIPALDLTETNLKNKIFLRNNIFYSFSIDSTHQYSYSESRSEDAARYASKKDLAAIRRLNSLDDGLIKYALTTVVDYAGYRVVCQSPVPGVFNEVIPLTEDAFDEEGELIIKEEDETSFVDKISYGSGDESNKIHESAVFEKALKHVGEFFHLKKHPVWSHYNNEYSNVAELITSLDTKGLQGDDNRLYVIDLFKTTPLDINFIEEHYSEKDDEKSYPFRQVLIRHELIDGWFSVQMDKEIKALTEEKKDEEDKKIIIDVKKFSFNPDVFSLKGEPSTLTKEQKEQIKEDERVVREIGDFLKVAIDDFISDIITGKSFVPLDGEHLTASLHDKGINLRYLGTIAKKLLIKKEEFLKSQNDSLDEIAKKNTELEAAEKSSDKEGDEDEELEEFVDDDYPDLTHSINTINAVYRVVIQEVLARVSKHLIRSLTNLSTLEYVPSIIAHYLNLLFGKEINDKPEFQVPNHLSINDSELVEVLPKLQISCDDLFEKVSNEAFRRFRIEITKVDIAEFVKFNDLSLLREIAIQFGFQLKARNYSFDKVSFDKTKIIITNDSKPDTQTKSKKNKKKASGPNTNGLSFIQTSVFMVSDIINLVPKIHDSIFPSSLAQEIWHTGRKYFFDGLSKTVDEKDEEAIKAKAQSTGFGITVMYESLGLHEQVYGSVHPKMAEIYSNLTNIYLELDDFDQAKSISEKVIIIEERTRGIDSYKTVMSLLSLAYIENSKGNLIAAIELYHYVLNILHYKTNGQSKSDIKSIHPLTITVLSNISSIYANLGKLPEALEIFKKVLKLSETFNGTENIITLMFKRNFANLQLQSGVIDEALREYNSLLHLLKKVLGVDNKLTKEAKIMVNRLARFTYQTSQNQKALRLQELKARAAANSNKVEPANVNGVNGSSKNKKKKNKKKKKSVSPSPTN